MMTSAEAYQTQFTVSSTTWKIRYAICTQFLTGHNAALKDKATI